MRLLLAILVFIDIFFTIKFNSLIGLIIGAVLIIGLLILDLSKIYSKDPIISVVFSPKGLNILALAVVTYAIGFYFNLANEYFDSDISLAISLVFIVINIIVNS